MKKSIYMMAGVFLLAMVGTYTFKLVFDKNYSKLEPVKVTVKPSAEAPHSAFTSDSSGKVVGYDLEAVETFRDTAKVSFSLKYAIENKSGQRVTFSFPVFGVDTEGVNVFEWEIKSVLNVGEKWTSKLPVSENLALEEYDRIASWKAGPITITVL